MADERDDMREQIAALKRRNERCEHEIEYHVVQAEVLREALQNCADAMESCVRVGSSSHVLIDGHAFRSARAEALRVLGQQAPQ